MKMAYHQNYYAKNSEQILTKRISCRERWHSQTRHKRWYEINKERLAGSCQPNKEHIRNYRRKYCKSNRERINEYRSSYFAKNKERIRQRLCDQKLRKLNQKVQIASVFLIWSVHASVKDWITWKSKVGWHPEKYWGIYTLPYMGVKCYCWLIPDHTTKRTARMLIGLNDVLT